MKEQLSDLEVSKVEAFCNDEAMFGAVRKILLAGLYTHGTLQQGFVPDPLVNGAFSLVSLALTNPIPDEVIGQTLRAQWAGVNALQNALEKMKQIKSSVKSPFVEENEAI